MSASGGTKPFEIGQPDDKIDDSAEESNAIATETATARELTSEGGDTSALMPCRRGAGCYRRPT